MSDRTQGQILITAPRERILDVIGDVPAYPEWATGTTAAEVTEAGDEREAAVGVGDDHFLFGVGGQHVEVGQHALQVGGGIPGEFAFAAAVFGSVDR